MCAKSPRFRRVLQSLLYEGIAVLIIAPVLSVVFDESAVSTFALSVILSTVALVWTYIFNTMFEHWEVRQRQRERTFRRRVAHGIGVEGGMVVFLVPIIAVWLQITLLEAFLADVGMLVFFFFYTIVFTWGFDKVFGLPKSAQESNE